MIEQESVLLDTDIGSDIDDTICLAYLLLEPHCNLMGITTVSGDTAKRASCCDALCRSVNRTDIPIFPGSSDVLAIGPGQPEVPRFVGLEGKIPFRTTWPRYKAVDFLRSTIHRYPHEITLLGIGPLTNIALLFAVDPQIPKLLKRLVLMCGMFSQRDENGEPVVEWNARVDPLAAMMVYRARAAEHRSIGLDVTRQCAMKSGEVLKNIKSPLREVVKAMTMTPEVENIVFHDPLAAASVFYPDLCSYSSGIVDVELFPADVAGRTRLADGPAPNHRVAASVNRESFFETLFHVMG